MCIRDSLGGSRAVAVGGRAGPAVRSGRAGKDPAAVDGRIEDPHASTEGLIDEGARTAVDERPAVVDQQDVEHPEREVPRHLLDAAAGEADGPDLAGLLELSLIH